MRREKVLNNNGPNDHDRVNNSNGMDDANSSAAGAAVAERLSVISFSSLKEVLWMTNRHLLCLSCAVMVALTEALVGLGRIGWG